MSDWAMDFAEKLIGPTYNEATEFDEKRRIAKMVREVVDSQLAAANEKNAEVLAVADEILTAYSARSNLGNELEREGSFVRVMQWRERLAKGELR